MAKVKQIKVIRPLSELQDTKPKLKVCAYCRVSTEHDVQESSYEAQKKHYEELIKSNSEWEFVRIYADKGSGKRITNRPEFNQMLEDCEDEKIDLIITKSISRFARNTLDTAKISRELKSKGIYIIFEKENVNTEKVESELTFNLMAGFAQMESESISKNVIQGYENRFKRGIPNVARPVFGYRKGKNEKEVFKIHKEEAEVVKVIFKMYTNNQSSYEIAEYLNKSEILSHTKLWTSKTILNIIKNDFYIGTLTLQKYIRDSKGKAIINKGEKPMYKIDDFHKGIISKKEFIKANEILKVRKKERGLEKELIRNTYPFSGIAKCNICGTTIVRNSIRPKNDPSYYCANKDCYGVSVTESQLYDNFLSLRNELIKNINYIDKNCNLEEYSDEIDNLKDKINNIKRQREIVYRLKEDKLIDSAIFIEKINYIENQILTFEKDIEKIKYDSNNSNTKKIVKYLKSLDKDEKVVKREEVENIIKEIKVKKDNVYFVLKNGMTYCYENKYKAYGGITAYGYKKKYNGYIVDTNEAEIVKFIFDEYLKRTNMVEICRLLKAKNVLTRNGKDYWHKETIKNILKNRNYCGNEIYPQIIESYKFNLANEKITYNQKKYTSKKT